jgi:hypothetical protein
LLLISFPSVGGQQTRFRSAPTRHWLIFSSSDRRRDSYSRSVPPKAGVYRLIFFGVSDRFLSSKARRQNFSPAYFPSPAPRRQGVLSSVRLSSFRFWVINCSKISASHCCVRAHPPSSSVLSFLFPVFSVASISFCSQIFIPCSKSQSVVGKCRPAGLVLESPVQRLEFFEFSLYSCGGFSDTPVSCLMKYVKGSEFFIYLILVAVALHVVLLALISVSAVCPGCLT